MHQKSIEMLNRKKDPNYSVISGYVPNELIEQVKEVMRETRLTQNEALEHALRIWLSSRKKIKDIHQLVEENLEALAADGFSREMLKSIIDRKMLPTAPDFVKIIAVLELGEQEAKQIWDATYTRSVNNEFAKPS